MLGRYLDALPADALQRICDATKWRTHGYADESGARCLLGHAENWCWGGDEQTHCGAPRVVAYRMAALDHMYNWPPLIGVRFDRLADRHGMGVVTAL